MLEGEVDWRRWKKRKMRLIKEEGIVAWAGIKLKLLDWWGWRSESSRGNVMWWNHLGWLFFLPHGLRETILKFVTEIMHFGKLYHFYSFILLSFENALYFVIAHRPIVSNQRRENHCFHHEESTNSYWLTGGIDNQSFKWIVLVKLLWWTRAPNHRWLWHVLREEQLFFH